MEFKIQKEIFDTFPDFIAGVILLKNINNRGGEAEITQLLREIEKEQIAKLSELENLSEHPQLNAWRMAYRKFGSDPHQYRCSAEALIRRVLKGDQLRHINKLVDLYNYVSLKYVLPVGGEDTDNIAGDLTLAFSDGTEPFIRLGGTENESPQKGEVVYKDREGVACRRWNWREAERTKLTEETKNAIIVVEALSPATCGDVETATKELADLIQKYCGGEANFYILSKNK
ncbi:MAG: phenylalanine--tRNA ligase beta subunit-related protein [Candidatus Pacebacteria bacterium]|nr:phenylalanine--tRNA ligase beta subunit-related protein [Candidatus Paceibacterota bacterium]